MQKQSQRITAYIMHLIRRSQTPINGGTNLNSAILVRNPTLHPLHTLYTCWKFAHQFLDYIGLKPGNRTAGDKSNCNAAS